MRALPLAAALLVLGSPACACTSMGALYLFVPLLYGMAILPFAALLFALGWGLRRVRGRRGRVVSDREAAGVLRVCAVVEVLTALWYAWLCASWGGAARAPWLAAAAAVPAALLALQGWFALRRALRGQFNRMEPCRSASTTPSRAPSKS